MSKFTISELSKVAFPVQAYEVRLHVKPGGQKGLNCAIYPVTLTALHKEREVKFTTSEGYESSINPVVFHRTIDDAKKHIVAVYGSNALVADEVHSLEMHA